MGVGVVAFIQVTRCTSLLFPRAVSHHSRPQGHAPWAGAAGGCTADSTKQQAAPGLGEPTVVTGLNKAAFMSSSGGPFGEALKQRQARTHVERF